VFGARSLLTWDYETARVGRTAPCRRPSRQPAPVRKRECRCEASTRPSSPARWSFRRGSWSRQAGRMC